MTDLAAGDYHKKGQESRRVGFLHFGDEELCKCYKGTNWSELGVMVHTCNPSRWEVEAGASRVQGSLGCVGCSCL